MCRIYKDPASTYRDEKKQGATIAFNICQEEGTWFSSLEVGKLAKARNIYIRTGSLCNPAGMAFALGIGPVELKKIYETGFRCGQEGDVIDNKLLGIVRVSIGAMSTLMDVEVFITFVEQTFINTNKNLTVALRKRLGEGLTSYETLKETKNKAFLMPAPRWRKWKNRLK